MDNRVLLLSRLKDLSNTLEVVINNLADSTWQPKKPNPYTRAEFLERSLWDGMESTLNREMRNLQKNIKDIMKLQQKNQSTLSEGWCDYNKCLKQSQDFLRECLEIIGTLAIRNSELDDKILYLTDQLIRDCLSSTVAISDYYLTVHGFGNVSSTKARIIRLRFPEWTIWDLPLVAHEVGDVVTSLIKIREKEGDQELRYLTRFLDSQRESLESILRGEGQAASDVSGWATGRVSELAADAFATYTMGPAYVCSAITLRLSPYVQAERDTPSNAQRAHVVVSMLRWMNKGASPVNNINYTRVIDILEQIWESTMDGGHLSNLSNSNKAYLKDFAEDFASNVCPQTLNKTALYPCTNSTDGWNLAIEWSNNWLAQLNSGNNNLTVPEHPPGKLRDVVNAIWDCRLSLIAIDKFSEAADRALASAGKTLCEQIIKSTLSRGERSFRRPKKGAH